MIIRISSIVLRKVSRKKPSISTKIIPYMLEISEKHDVSMEHISNMCMNFMEIEAATVAVQVVLVLINLAKRRTS